MKIEGSGEKEVKGQDMEQIFSTYMEYSGSYVLQSITIYDEHANKNMIISPVIWPRKKSINIKNPVILGQHQVHILSSNIRKDFKYILQL